MRFNLKKTLAVLAACLAMPFFALAQNITVSGTVTDKSGETVIGAAVMVINSSNGAVTGVDGSYSLQVGPNATLEVSCMGYTTQRVPVQGRSRIDIVLSDDAQALDAIVVIGYGSARRQDVTGSIASMGGDNLREIAAGDFTRSLNGRVAGVQMTQTNSKPGASMEIRIRGDRSLSASNDPLIVLDGVPFMGSLSDIATGDIKSMDILKDASSTAIYGSRGANGVILITTYKGVSGQAPKVSFNNYLSIKKAIKYPMMNGPQYAKMRALAGKFTNKIGYEDDATDTDWQDLFYRTGITHNHELSVVGGTMKGSYRFGVSYYKDEAVVPTQDYDRISLSGSLDQNIRDWFKIGFSTNTSYSRNHGNQIGLYGILQLTPILSAVDAEGNNLVRASMPLDNVWIPTRKNIEEASDRWVNEGFGFGSYNTGYVELRAPWVEGLSFKQTVGLNYRSNKSGWFTGKGVNDFNVANPNSAGISQNETKNWSSESLLTFDRTFGKHHINAVAMFSAEQTTYIQNGLSARNIFSEQFLYYNLGQALAEDITVSPNSSNYWQAGLISYMGRVMYSYADRYMISAAVRSDASSRLAPGHQWHTYPAVSIGWNIHNEPFMEGTRGWLDELKFRAGYGETSNQAISPYQTLGSLGTRPYNFGEKTYAVGTYVSTLPNDELGWEYSNTWNFGLDFGFFNGRLNGTIEYYRQSTHDILLGMKLPSTSGVGGYTANIGATQNHGIEFSLNGTIIDNRDWKWDAGINIYANRNKLVALASGQKEDRDNRWFVGYPINCLYDFEYDGLWQKGEEELMAILEPGAAPGDIKVKYHGDYDAAGKPVRALNDDDKVPISADPLFLGGFNTRLQYKNWDLTILGNFQAGGILISTLHGAGGYLNMLTGRRGNIAVDYWTESNTGAHYPRPGGLISGDNPKYGSTLAYFNGSYLKIGTITLGYNFDKIPALRRAGIDRLRIYATAQNPFVFFSQFHNETGLDPEPNSRGTENQAVASYAYRQKVIGTNTPNTRNYLFGINITF